MYCSRIFALMLAIVLFFSLSTLDYAVAGGKTAAGGSDEMKALLLRPNGWLAVWKGETYSGESEFMFEERGENVVVKIVVLSFNQSCERDVKITSDVIKLDGCNETGIQLHYDPNDKEYPFKGDSQQTNYKLKEK